MVPSTWAGGDVSGLRHRKQSGHVAHSPSNSSVSMGVCAHHPIPLEVYSSLGGVRVKLKTV